MASAAVYALRQRMQESILQAAAQDPEPDHTDHSEVPMAEAGVHYAIVAHLTEDHGISLTDVMGGTMSMVEIHDRVHGLFIEVPEDAPSAVLPSGEYRVVLSNIDRRHGPAVQIEQRINREWHGTPGNYYATSIENLLDYDRRFYIDLGADWSLSHEDTKALGAFATLALALYGRGQA